MNNQENKNKTLWQKINKKWLAFVTLLLSPFVLAGIFILIAALIRFGAVANTLVKWAEYSTYYGLWISSLIFLITLTIFFVIKHKTLAWLTGLAISLFTWIPFVLQKLIYATFPHGYIISARISNIVQGIIFYTALVSVFLWPIFLATSLIIYIQRIKQSRLWKILIIFTTILIEITQAALITILYIMSAGYG
jgi:hypothetical protein